MMDGLTREQIRGIAAGDHRTAAGARALGLTREQVRALAAGDDTILGVVKISQIGTRKDDDA
jgi:ribosomal protein S14